MSLLSKSVSIKHLQTNKTIVFNMNPNWTISQIKPHISKVFKISVDNLELIAPKVQDSNAVLKNIWGPNLNVILYIKRKSTSYSLDECPICYETKQISQNYTCSHKLCDSCYHDCIMCNHISCPVCRHK